MRGILIILFIIIIHVSYGQCEGMKNDTVPYNFVTGKKLYNYYHQDGRLAWADVKEYDKNLIPPNGTFTFYYTNLKSVKGFKIWRTKEDCVMWRVGYLDANKKALPISIVVLDEDTIL